MRGHRAIARVFLAWGLLALLFMTIALAVTLAGGRPVEHFTEVRDAHDVLYAIGFALLLALPLVRNLAVVIRADGRTRALAALSGCALIVVYVVALTVRTAS